MKNSLLSFALILGVSLPAVAAPQYKVETLAEGLDSPWSLALLPNGDKLITELPGRLRLMKGNKLLAKPVSGVPKVFYGGQGGLMDVILDPNFKRNRTIYLSYAAEVKEGKNATHVMRAVLSGNRLIQKKVIFIAKPLKNTPVHYGGRMAFMKDGTLLVGLGDGFDFREDAQNPKNHIGAIVRIDRNGRAPKNNPYVRNKKGAAEVWTYGHRNVQAVVVDSRGRVFANEHGPQGGDEINLIEKGKNYGWPMITYGLDYSGATISPWTERKGMEQPLHQWTPSIAPSAMVLYEGRLFPELRGSLLVPSLLFGRVERFTLKGNKVVGKPEFLFKGLDDRLRDIRVGAKGEIYILGEVEGRLFKITPK